jgi:hypothetical protein
MDVSTAINQRRSVGAYKDTDVEEEKLKKTLTLSETLRQEFLKLVGGIIM